MSFKVGRYVKYLAKIFIIFAISTNSNAQSREFKKWPKGKSPQEIGRLVTNRFISTPHTNFGSLKPATEITYSEVCAWYGALKFSKADQNESALAALEQRYRPLQKEKIKLVPKADHVDHTVFATIPLELYINNRDTTLLNFGLRYANAQWELPASKKPEYKKLLDSGFSWQTRMWIDDAFMITLIQSQAYRATGDEIYINRAAKEMIKYLDEMQSDNGLFHHSAKAPYYWGRGNGWMAAGMTELLSSLPKNHPTRPRIMRGYQTMMASLLKYQSKSGMWNQLIDEPTAWAESSCTGMFTYAIIMGVKNGWLNDKTYASAARKGWLALVSYIDDKGDVKQVCEGTNISSDKQFYLNRKRITGDMHGQAPILWCSYALLAPISK